MATPIIIETELGQALAQINQKLDNLQKDVTDIKIGQTKLEGEIKTLERELKGEIKALDVEVKGISKRLENQEFLSRGVLIGLIVAIAGGAAKLFGFVGNP